MYLWIAWWRYAIVARHVDNTKRYASHSKYDHIHFQGMGGRCRNKKARLVPHTELQQNLLLIEYQQVKCF